METSETKLADEDPVDEDLEFAEIEQLSDYEISWLLLAILLRSHSPAGVSLDRSPRNVLLQQIVNLLDRPKLPVAELAAKSSVVLADCWDRISHYERKLPPQQMLLPFYEPEYLDNSILAEILLVELRQWYQADAKRHRYGHSLMTEMKWLHPALILIGLNEGIYLDPHHWWMDPQSIVNESRERQHRRWYEENDMAYWHRHKYC